MKKTYIAITGNIGCGKTTISNFLKTIGYNVIDVDKISHNLLDSEQIISKLKNIFGNFFLENNKVNRKKLGDYVFKSKENLKILNSIMHPEIIKELENQMINSKDKFVFVDIPLLFELKLENKFDKIICTNLSKKIQIQRIKIRDNLTYKKIRNVIRNQLSLQYKIEKSNYLVRTKNKKYLKKDIMYILKEIKNENK